MTRKLGEIIQAFLSRHPGQGFTNKELARQLRMPKQGDVYAQLKFALAELQASGTISRIDGRKWTISTDETALAGESPALPSVPSSGGRKGKRSRDESLVEGELRLTKGGDGILLTREFPGQEIRIPKSQRYNAESGDLVRASVWMEDQKITGEIVEILSASDSLATGTMKQLRQGWYIEPDGRENKRDVLVRKKLPPGLRDGDKVAFRYLLDGFGERRAEGEILQVLGKSGSPDIEILALAQRFGFSFDFPVGVEKEAKSIPHSIPPEVIAERLDFRDQICFTIDPEEAKDFDDAVSLKRDENGDYLLGVHIADVSAFVREDTELDNEALKRGTSVYMVDNVVHMLPERLSNRICCLEEGKDRLAFSVFLTISPRGAIKKHEFCKTVINSKRRFTYEEAEEILESGTGDFVETLEELRSLAAILMKKRFKAGSIDFDLPEMKFVCDSRGFPTEIIPKKRLMSMRIIEECMLLANKTVAEAIRAVRRKDAPLPFIYRVHDLPDKTKVRELVEFLDHHGIHIPLDPASPKSFQNLLETVKDTEHSAVIQDVILRTMAKAAYSEKNIGHFGLSFPDYTHFTSPIRRYPDLLVHRLLSAYIVNGFKPRGSVHQETESLGRMALQCSSRERIAVDAERESVKIMEIAYLQQHLGDEFEGVVSGVTEYGLWVELLPTLVEGMVHVKYMSDDYYEFNAARKSLTGKRTRKRYQVGATVRVRLSSADMATRRVDLLLL